MYELHELSGQSDILSFICMIIHYNLFRESFNIISSEFLMSKYDSILFKKGLGILRWMNRRKSLVEQSRNDLENF